MQIQHFCICIVFIASVSPVSFVRCTLYCMHWYGECSVFSHLIIFAPTFRFCFRSRNKSNRLHQPPSMYCATHCAIRIQFSLISHFYSLQATNRCSKLRTDHTKVVEQLKIVYSHWLMSLHSNIFALTRPRRCCSSRSPCSKPSLDATPSVASLRLLTSMK